MSLIYEHILTVPCGEQIVSMVQFRDVVYVATNERIYRIVDDGCEVGLKPVRLDSIPPLEQI
jgi:hypothetical protein